MAGKEDFVSANNSFGIDTTPPSGFTKYSNGIGENTTILRLEPEFLICTLMAELCDIPEICNNSDLRNKVHEILKKAIH